MSEPILSAAEALADWKRWTYERIDQMHQRLLLKYAGNPTPAEMATWTAKADASAAQVAGTATARQTAMLQAEADLVGITIDQLATKIQTKAALFEVIAGKLAGMRGQGRAAVAAATDKAGVDATWATCKAAAATIETEIQALLAG